MSALNCRPGDMAIVVSVPIPKLNEWLGKVVRVTTLTTSWDGFPCWNLEKHVRDCVGICEAIADRDLRPIRDPGSDAVDEMVQRVGPAPMTLTEILQGVAHG